jgi:hypothetical protein
MEDKKSIEKNLPYIQEKLEKLEQQNESEIHIKRELVEATLKQNPERNLEQPRPGVMLSEAQSKLPITRSQPGSLRDIYTSNQEPKSGIVLLAKAMDLKQILVTQSLPGSLRKIDSSQSNSPSNSSRESNLSQESNSSRDSKESQSNIIQSEAPRSESELSSWGPTQNPSRQHSSRNDVHLLKDLFDSA